MLLSMRTWRRVIYPLIGAMILVVFGLSLYENYVLEAGPDVSSFIGVPAATGTLPQEDYYGVYLQLKPGADPQFPSNLVQLLETDSPGVVTTTKQLQEPAAAIDAVLVYQAAIDEDASQYRVYAIGADPQDVLTQRISSGRMLRIQPKSGRWPPGSYLADVPSGGMFDTSRVYYSFGVK